MDSLIDKLGLYDIFGILFSGMIAVISAEVILLGIITSFVSSYSNDFISGCVFFMISYVIGLILQELSSAIDKKYFRLREGPKREYLKADNTVLKTGEETVVYTELGKKILTQLNRPCDEISEDQMQYIYYHCASVLEIQKKDGKLKRISSIFGLSKSLSFLFLSLVFIAFFCKLYWHALVCGALCILFFVRAKRFAKFKIRVALRHYHVLHRTENEIEKK